MSGSEPVATPPEIEAEAERAHANRFALEVCFLGLVGVVVVAAFLEALSYQLVSSRTPFVIMAPLFVLILVHARRLWLERRGTHVGGHIRAALGGASVHFSKVVGLAAWLVGLMAMIVTIGHYAAIAIFAYVLMGPVARERRRLSLAVAVGTTVVLFLLFEYAFNIELYRGLIVRYFLGYRDF